jgi:hypothetical protein
VAHTKAVDGVIDQEEERNEGKETNKKSRGLKTKKEIVMICFLLMIPTKKIPLIPLIPGIAFIVFFSFRNVTQFLLQQKERKLVCFGQILKVDKNGQRYYFGLYGEFDPVSY